MTKKIFSVIVSILMIFTLSVNTKANETKKNPITVEIVKFDQAVEKESKPLSNPKNDRANCLVLTTDVSAPIDRNEEVELYFINNCAGERRYEVEIQSKSGDTLYEAYGYVDSYQDIRVVGTYSTLPSGEFYISYSYNYNEIDRVPITIKANEHEFITNNIPGTQNAINDNINNPQSMWKNTNLKFQEYSFYREINYELKLEEMIVGEEANLLAEYESSSNIDATPTTNWTFFKFNIKNNSSQILDTHNIVHMNMFITKDGNSIIPHDSASFSQEKEGYQPWDVDLNPNRSATLWVGYLFDKTDIYPILEFNNGLNSYDDQVFSYLDVDPANSRVGWYEENGNKYYYHQPGQKAIGWHKVDGQWEFFNNSGVHQYNDWNTHYANDEIKLAMDKGWIDNSTNFRPEDRITRAEFIKIVNQAYGYNKPASGHNFDDVPSYKWFYNHVLVAVNHGVINASQQSFRPDDEISREEVAEILTNINRNKDNNYDKMRKYDDYLDVSNWAKPAVEGAIEAGYMGKGVSTLKPKDSISRADAILMVTRSV